MAWYGVKGVFRWGFKNSNGTERYETRIVVFEAESFDQALEKAEAEANAYIVDDPTSNVRIENLGIFNAFSISQEQLGEGVEVYSEGYKSALGAKKYIEKYEPESGERS